MYVIISYFSDNPLLDINHYMEKFYGNSTYKYDINLSQLSTQTVNRMNDSTIYYISIIDKTHLDILINTLNANPDVKGKKIIIDVKSSYMMDGLVTYLKEKKLTAKFVSKDLPNQLHEINAGVNLTNQEFYIPLETQIALNFTQDTNIQNVEILSSILNNDVFRKYNEKIVKLLNSVNTDPENKLIIFKKSTNQTLVNLVKYAVKVNGNKNVYVAHGFDEYVKLLRHQFSSIYIYNELDKFDIWAVTGFNVNTKVHVLLYNTNDSTKNLINSYDVVKEEQKYILGDIISKYSFKK